MSWEEGKIGSNGWENSMERRGEERRGEAK
jgi:hypothetical protein